MNKLLLFLSFSFFLFVSLSAQVEKTAASSENNLKTSSLKSNKLTSPLTAGDEINFKDSDGNSIITVVDEGDGAGSILIPAITDVGSGSVTSKLINAAGTLYWDGNAIGIGNSPWTSAGSFIYPKVLTDKVGLGTNTPGADLDIRSSEPGTRAILHLGNSDRSHRLDFSSGSNSQNPYIIWEDGDKLTFGSGTGLSFTNQMQIESNGNVGIGITTTADAKLDVEGQIKIRGGSPGNGKILTSDASGLATWEDKNPVAAFNATLTSTVALTGNTEAQLVTFYENFDDGNGFNPTTGVYTVPSSGVYQFMIKVLWTSTASLSGIEAWTSIKVNGGNYFRFDDLIDFVTSSDRNSSFVSFLLNVSAGDEITFFTKIYNSTNAISAWGNGSTNSTNVSGFKIH